MTTYAVSHLDGETVAVVADGKYIGTQVVTSGIVTVADSYSHVHIGLPYYSEIETLDIEIPSKSGTLQGSKIKVGNLTYRFVESRGGWVGPDEDNLYEAFTDEKASLASSHLDFNPSDYDWEGMSITDPTPYLYTGDIRVPLDASYSVGGRSYFRQVDPIPVTISAIIPEIKIGEPTG